jgi:hypothetical protein
MLFNRVSACLTTTTIHRPTLLPPTQAAESDLLRISNKVRFILAVVGGHLKLSNRRKAEVEQELEDEGYDRLPAQKKALAQVGGGWERLEGGRRELRERSLEVVGGYMCE